MAKQLIYTRKQYDTGPPFRLEIRNESTGEPVDLTGSTVVFNLYRNGTQILNAAGSVESPASGGVVRYDIQANDLATAGDLEAEFEISYAAGTIETYPAAGYIRVLVTPDLDGGTP